MRKKFCDKCNKPMKTDEGRIFYWDSISALAVIVGKFHIRNAITGQLIAECVTSEDLELIAHYRTSAPKLATKIVPLIEACESAIKLLRGSGFTENCPTLIKLKEALNE